MSRKVRKQLELMGECLGEIEKKGFTMIEMGSDEAMEAAWGWGRGGLKRLTVHGWKCAGRAMLLMTGMKGGKEWSRVQRDKSVLRGCIEEKREVISLFNLRELVENKVFILGGSRQGRQESWIRFPDEIPFKVEMDVEFIENISKKN